MSHQPARRRNLAAPRPDPETSMDPTPHNQHHHHPDPSVNPSATVQNISNHFSRLYLNHKARSFSRSQPNAMALSSISDSSTTASLTKSQSQRSRGSRNSGKSHYYYSNNYFKQVHEQEDSIKKAIVVGSTLPKKKEEIEEEDVAVVKKNNKGYVDLISADKEKGGLGDDGLKKPQQGYEVKMHSFPSIGMGKGKRRSFGSSSQAELADFFACSSVKVVSADMPQFMQIHAVDVARKTYDSLEKFTAKTLALTLKKEFDVVYGPAWHCIVGSSFGSFVTHSVGGFIYFSMDQKLYVLLFKTTVQRAAAH